MADANFKPRRLRARSVHHVPAILEDAPASGTPSVSCLSRPAFPWMHVADVWLAQAGFAPGQPVLLSFDYNTRCLTISPDYDCTIAGRPMAGAGAMA
ncbi:type I toxin-antitoxin system SymE family toxin [Paraburkholderia silviterrae]|nr:type I toxin-antitoxin system SymE family toxin [Paraburkholderia silviterrae]